MIPSGGGQGKTGRNDLFNLAAPTGTIRGRNPLPGLALMSTHTLVFHRTPPTKGIGGCHTVPTFIV